MVCRAAHRFVGEYFRGLIVASSMRWPSSTPDAWINQMNHSILAASALRIPRPGRPRGEVPREYTSSLPAPSDSCRYNDIYFGCVLSRQSRHRVCLSALVDVAARTSGADHSKNYALITGAAALEDSTGHLNANPALERCYAIRCTGCTNRDY
jgi:hypothetical protein